MQFIHQSLTWGFLLILLPLLIHLINMMRHRRVQWAAMDFLLQSYRKHRKWIWLRQLLLLLLRMVITALVVAMLAKPITGGRFLDFFGQQTTHHFVLLDDSFSMSDRYGSTTAFDKATRVTRQIAADALEQRGGTHKFTLLRFSQAISSETVNSSIGQLGQLADFNAEIVGSGFDLMLEEKHNTMRVTEISVSPLAALKVVHQLMDQGLDETRLLYLISDFRATDWGDPEEIVGQIAELDQGTAQIHLVNCVTETRQNLAVTQLISSNDTQAAGVPLFVNVAVHNFGKEPERNVQLTIRQTFHQPQAISLGTVEELAGQTEEINLPPIEIIPAGETIETRVQVAFPDAGKHVVEAQIKGGDAIDIDNRRWGIVDLPESQRVLVLDGSPEQIHAFYLGFVFQPGPRVKTGIETDVRVGMQFLRDTSPEELSNYSAIYLLDVPRFDSVGISHLESYVRQGGGLAIFLGDNVSLSNYNEHLYKDGNGLLPLPLGRIALLPPDIEEDTPDIVATDHSVFAYFSKYRDSIINKVSVDEYVKPREDWIHNPDSSVQIAAELRNKDPLVVDHTFGDGRIMTYLTTLGPVWNNWATEAYLVVMALKLQSHLSAQQRRVDEQLVAAAFDFPLPLDEYRKDVKFFLPGKDAERTEVERSTAAVTAASNQSAVNVGYTGLKSTETAQSGIYDALLTTKDGNLQATRFAVNIDTSESDLTVADSRTLVARFEGLGVRYLQAEDFDVGTHQTSPDRSLTLMALLTGFLIFEQLIALFCSYHPVRGGIRHVTG